MMAGVVRRDGLREAVSLRARLERERDVLERLAHHPCPCPRDTPVPEVAAVDAIIDHLARVLEAVPDVPPDAQQAFEEGYRMGREVALEQPDVPPDPPAADLADDLALDYIRAYYALVTAARALLDAMTRFGPDDSGQLWDAAQALRALVGDETPGTGDGA